MLVTLFGQNFRSLRDPFELSMVAADLKREQDSSRGTMDVPIDGAEKPLKLLRAAAIFGPNGSGKSTVLLAARALRWLIRMSSPIGKPGVNIPPYEPFALDKQTRNAPVTLGCRVVFGRSLLTYKISFAAQAIEHELLTRHDAEGEAVLIDRRGANVAGQLVENSQVNKLYVTQMQPHVAVLSKLAQHGPAERDEAARPYEQALLGAIEYEDFSDACFQRVGLPAHERFADESKYRNWIMRTLMKKADVGIGSVRVERKEVDIPKPLLDLAAKLGSPKLPEKQVVVSFVHEGAERQSLDFSEESAGTKKLFNIGNRWHALAHQHICLFADELTASLHPVLLRALIGAVNEAAPQMRSQLIFATHDTGLLEGQDGKAAALRRDQFYFTEKDADGASSLYPLSEFKDSARPVHNARKRYLSGLYGAVPLVERFAL